MLAETEFLKKPLSKPKVKINSNHAIFFAVLIGIASLAAYRYEERSWEADIMVRKADLFLLESCFCSIKAFL